MRLFKRQSKRATVVSPRAAFVIEALEERRLLSGTVFYSTDFDGNRVGDTNATWSVIKKDIAPNRPGNYFMGQFGQSGTTLNLQNIPAHNQLTVEFDLLMIRSWDGNAGSPWGPDRWKLTADGSTVIDTTFRNTPLSLGGSQEFGGLDNPNGSFPAFTGSQEHNSLGYTYYSSATSQHEQADAIYHLKFDINHANSTIALAFLGAPNQALADESWGIDNVKILMPQPVVNIEALTDQTTEGSNTRGQFRIWRQGDLSKPQLIDYRIGGTADNGTDYDNLPLMVGLDAGQESEIVDVVALADGVFENDETVLATITTESEAPDYAVGAHSSATITIQDVDAYAGINVESTTVGVGESHNVRVKVLDDDGNPISGAALTIQDFDSEYIFAEWGPAGNLTDGLGIASVIVHGIREGTSQLLIAGPPATLPGQAQQKVQVPTQYKPGDDSLNDPEGDVQDNTGLQVLAHPARPIDSLQATPGETITLHFATQDYDWQRPVAGGEWQQFLSPGPFSANGTIKNGKNPANPPGASFVGAGALGKFMLQRIGADSGNILMKIDPAWTGDFIVVKFTIKDAAKPIQAPHQGEVVDQPKYYEWKITRRLTPAPKTMTAVEGQEKQWAAVTANNPLRFTYKLGPDIDGDGQADYTDQTIEETFADPTANFDMNDLTEAFKTAHAELDTPAKVAKTIFGTSSSATFVIDANDRIKDAHGGYKQDQIAIFTDEALAKDNGVGDEFVQTFEAGGSAIGTYTIGRRVRKTGDGQLVMEIKKWPAP